MGGVCSRRRFFAPSALIFAVDVVVLITSTVIAIVLRQTIPGFATEGRDVEAFVRPVANALIPAWLVLLLLSGSYERRWLGSGPQEFRRVLNVGLLTAASLGVGAYLFQYPLSRGFYTLLFLTAIPLQLLCRWLLRRALHAMLRGGKFNTTVLIAGDHHHIADLLPTLERNRWIGFRPVGLLMREAPPDGQLFGLPVLGRPADAVNAIESTQANAVIFTEGSFTKAHDFNRLAAQLEGFDAQTIVVPALSDISAGRMIVRPVAGMPLVHVERPTAAHASRWGKRLFDIIGASAAILISSPIMLAVAIAIRLDDGGPVLFRQERVGFKGSRFDCLKFRSMVTNAEELKAQLMASNESDGALFKMAKDPRITKVGHVIRKYSLDEFPQFFNVLKGDMSLVGPRPALPSEVETYKSHVLRRLDVRPGITGLWQVSGRSDLPWEETVRLDLYYVDNWSMLQDITILFRTVKVVLTGSGAY